MKDKAHLIKLTLESYGRNISISNEDSEIDLEFFMDMIDFILKNSGYKYADIERYITEWSDDILREKN